MPRTTVPRRGVLTGAAAAGAGLASPSLIGGTASASGLAAAPAATPSGTINDIQHVVFLILENRSFDHLFGSMSGVRGLDDRTVARPDGSSIFAQREAVTGPDELPFMLSQANNGQNTPSLSHKLGPQHLSRHNGADDNWITAHRGAHGGPRPPFPRLSGGPGLVAGTRTHSPERHLNGAEPPRRVARVCLDRADPHRVS